MNKTLLITILNWKIVENYCHFSCISQYFIPHRLKVIKPTLKKALFRAQFTFLTLIIVYITFKSIYLIIKHTFECLIVSKLGFESNWGNFFRHYY